MNCRSKETEGKDKNELGFELTPPCETLFGTLLAFLVGVNGKPIDLSISQYRRSKKSLRKKQNAGNEEREEKEEEVEPGETGTEREVHLQGLPYDSTEETIRDFLDECGTIEEVRIPT